VGWGRQAGGGRQSCPASCLTMPPNSMSSQWMPSFLPCSSGASRVRQLSHVRSKVGALKRAKRSVFVAMPIRWFYGIQRCCRRLQAVDSELKVWRAGARGGGARRTWRDRWRGSLALVFVDVFTPVEYVAVHEPRAYAPPFWRRLASSGVVDTEGSPRAGDSGGVRRKGFARNLPPLPCSAVCSV